MPLASVPEMTCHYANMRYIRWIGLHGIKVLISVCVVVMSQMLSPKPSKKLQCYWRARKLTSLVSNCCSWRISWSIKRRRFVTHCDCCSFQSTSTVCWCAFFCVLRCSTFIPVGCQNHELLARNASSGTCSASQRTTMTRNWAQGTQDWIPNTRMHRKQDDKTLQSPEGRKLFLYLQVILLKK